MGAFDGAAGARTARLEQSVADGDAYGALQTYKTFHARSLKKGDVHAAVDLLRSGSVALLKHGNLTAGAELALMLVDTLNDGKVEQDDEVKAILLQVADAFEALQGEKAVVAEAAKSEARYLRAAISWSTLKNFGQHPRGDPDLHLRRARTLIRAGSLADASANYLHAGKPAEFAAFLVQWSQLGYRGERDLFLARGVLQLLALENLKDANELHAAFYETLKSKGLSMQASPLANFVSFLLRTLERDAFPLFQMLCQKYSASTSRDPSFQQYLDRIQEVFFKVKPQKRGMQAMLENMLGMFGG